MIEETALPTNRILYMASWAFVILIPLVFLNHLYLYFFDNPDPFIDYPGPTAPITPMELLVKIYSYIVYLNIFYISFKSRKNFSGLLPSKDSYTMTKAFFIFSAINSGNLFLAWLVFNINSQLQHESVLHMVSLIFKSAIIGGAALYLTASLIYFKRHKLVV